MTKQVGLVGVGPQRTGTSWLHAQLSRHSRLCFPRRVKETFFFDERFHKGLEWYWSHFYHCSGNGTFRISTIKPINKKAKKEVRIEKDRFKVWFFKALAIDVGRLPQLDQYQIIARFIDKNNRKTEYKQMAKFTIFDRDKFYYAILLSLLAIATTTIVAWIMRSCSVPV